MPAAAAMGKLVRSGVYEDEYQKVYLKLPAAK